MGRIEEKVVVVTGGARGIGHAICLLFAREGAAVAVTDVIDDEGRQVVELIRGTGGKADFWHLDTSREENVVQVFSEVADQWGELNVLVNNAGIAGPNKATHDIDAEEWDRVISINVRGLFFCTKHAVPYMQKGKGGSIINLSSRFGVLAVSNSVPCPNPLGKPPRPSMTNSTILASAGCSKFLMRLKFIFLLLSLPHNAGQRLSPSELHDTRL